MSKVRNIGIEANPPSKECDDSLCPWHGTLPVRGRIVEGKVESTKMNKTLVIRRDFLHLVKKYNRYEKRHGSLSARNPSCIDAKSGDVVKVMECRHIAKHVSFVVIEKLAIAN
ncbi:MAG: 30S ribosomal protein S17P [Candidatus Heimdallarchaeota archaeon LC_2]|uniref:Putative 30S ribosomal protein S17P n=1 Tax=uncultured organism TaxID=155900 RepID=A0A0F6PYH7_9ZZZZ|nr:putative 30S ribosomal protein S17P [uncultured organism]OLS28545.1 MAG: 30S ribosomal protein S17P [Candidatus Heimdallarchaeota archaeon LC_2]